MGKIVRVGNEWIKGYACACAVVAKLGTHFDGMSLLKEGGLSIADLYEADAEQSDIDALLGDRNG